MTDLGPVHRMGPVAVMVSAAVPLKSTAGQVERVLEGLRARLPDGPLELHVDVQHPWALVLSLLHDGAPHTHVDVGGGFCGCGAQRCSLRECDSWCVHGVDGRDGWLSNRELYEMRQQQQRAALMAAAHVRVDDGVARLLRGS